MRNSNRFNLTHTALLGLAMTVAGTSVAMAQSATAMDSKTTANEASETPVSDTWITTKVKADLLVTEEVKGLDINVSTTNGVVTLAGMLDSQAQVDKALSVATAIKGVQSVDTKALKVKPAK